MTQIGFHGREQSKINSLGHADIVIGIPSYQSGSGIVHVIKTAAEGLDKYYPKLKSVIIISDGGSTDGSREKARDADISDSIEKIVALYDGTPGKGSSLMAVFDAAEHLKAKAIAVFDSDLKSITPEWVKNIIDPVLHGFDYAAPFYTRYKYDGTITNTIIYNITRALYGCKIRQPIGGDFGISADLAAHYLNLDDWETDVSAFGIDIWMTMSAIAGGFKICQARLGAKVHGEKDPSADLAPMFRQVVGTAFRMMERYEDYWCNIKITKDIPAIGEHTDLEPRAFEVDRDKLIRNFMNGIHSCGKVWESVLDERDLKTVGRLASCSSSQFYFTNESWARIVYNYAAAFNKKKDHRQILLDSMIPLYNARVASFVNDLSEKNTEGSEQYFEEQARVFENMRDYMLAVWNGQN